jgi:hypothetical protein
MVNREGGDLSICPLTPSGSAPVLSVNVHFSYPSKNHQLTDLQKSLGLKIKTISRISNTRWKCRYKNYEALKQCFKSILSILNKDIKN